MRLALVSDDLDVELAELDDEQAAIEPTLGGSTLHGTEATDDPAECPFELGIGEPMVMSAARVWEASGHTPPPEFNGLPGNRALMLMIHRLTPFPRPGYPVTRVWGMGLRVDVLDERTNTIDFAPRSEFVDYADADANVGLALSASGEFAVAPEGLELLNAATGVGMKDFGLSGTVKTGFRLGAKVNVSSLRVQAGAVDRGVRWDLVRDDRRLTASVQLLHTLALPSELKRLPLRLTAWVRRRRFFGRPDVRIWTTEGIAKSVDVRI